MDRISLFRRFYSQDGGLMNSQNNSDQPSQQADTTQPVKPAALLTPEMLKKLNHISEAAEYQKRPSKIVLEFKLPEEQEFYHAALRAMELRFTLLDVILWLTSIRHGTPLGRPPCHDLEIVLRVLEEKMDTLGLND